MAEYMALNLSSGTKKEMLVIGLPFLAVVVDSLLYKACSVSLIYIASIAAKGTGRFLFN